jgi:hypothetical protein
MKQLSTLLAYACLLIALPAVAQNRLQPHTEYLFHQTDEQEQGSYSLSRTKTNGLSALRVGKKDSAKTYPKVQVGGLLHLVGVNLQQKPTNAQLASPDYRRGWERQMSVYRGRILVGGNISEKTSFFIETEVPVPVGNITVDTSGARKTMQVAPVLLDAQVEHIFSKELSVIAGLQLVGITRNGLQSAASLMALDFGYFQYPYNLFQTSALQGNFGRDVGVNLRGFLANERLEYRMGLFAGRTFDRSSPLRFVTRLNYNFLDKEKDLYYTGTTLGQGKIFAIGGGVDLQTTYQNFGIDAFLDLPVGEAGSITLNTAFNSITGGEAFHQYSFRDLIPRQTIHFVELGYYFKRVKLLPYFKYENQIVNGKPLQYGLPNTPAPQQVIDFQNTMLSNMRIGGGIGYYFAGYNSTLKLAYESVSYGHINPDITATTKRRGEIWLQLQLFVF